MQIRSELPTHCVVESNTSCMCITTYESSIVPPGYVPEAAVPEEDTDRLEDDIRSLSLRGDTSSLIVVNPDVTGNFTTHPPPTARDIILARCGQREPLPFEECYPRSVLEHCHKIGEGVYGEVFLYRNPKGGTSVMKVIPIEGNQTVNGEHQKKFEDILSEVIIALELSDLRRGKENCTSGFSEVQSIRCVKGVYPSRLIYLWDLYADTCGTENDSPLMFRSKQLYIVLEFAYAGKDLEAFVFNNALQAFSMFQQVACALAVAESQLKFEHRDLHWGNILISTVDKEKDSIFRLKGKDIILPSYGVNVAIIDFTLSRIEHDGVIIYLDLSQDNELFMAKGDYQFDIYRLMQENNENEWQHYEPYTNILWLHYILDKAITALRYKNIKSRTHRNLLEKLANYKDVILKYRSVTSFVLENNIGS